eukprot:scaffold91091_cov60-Phaeocystis_antarctica.AAC.5
MQCHISKPRSQSSKLTACSNMTDCSTTTHPLPLRLLTSPVAFAGLSLRAGGTSHGNRQNEKCRCGSTSQKSPTTAAAAAAAAAGTVAFAVATTAPLISASAAATVAAATVAAATVDAVLGNRRSPENHTTAASAAPAPRVGGGHGTRAHPQLPWWGLPPGGKVSAAWHRMSSGGAARERFHRAVAAAKSSGFLTLCTKRARPLQYSAVASSGFGWPSLPVAWCSITPGWSKCPGAATMRVEALAAIVARKTL